jgi:hypothetical protein
MLAMAEWVTNTLYSPINVRENPRYETTLGLQIRMLPGRIRELEHAGNL